MAEFAPTLGLSAERAEEVVRIAGKAPSLHNRQPWRFRLLHRSIELHYDPRARLPATDPRERELRIGCGAALLNMRLALEHEGVSPVVTLLPNTGAESVLAEIRGEGSSNMPPGQRVLYRAIADRHTNRRPFRETPVTLEQRHSLLESVAREGCWLHIVERGELGRLEGMVHRAHRAQLADPRFREELAGWTGHDADVSEGIPASAAGPEREPQDQWVLRDYSAGKAKPRVPGKDFEYDPLLLVVCSYYEGRAADLRAGQALQRMLLTATANGLVASLMSQVIEIDETREELRGMLDGSLRPQALLRVGHGSRTAPTPRREPRELLL
ncbi:Acg family FMN-binding oxidoreductase [Actinopolyspora sp. H202]|uniref:Acg family FMN-binding oxidoreductase n=1 Tax=Actinopolyspora sp. H202 TaxID=1500456 RepID=UPI003EE68B83